MPRHAARRWAPTVALLAGCTAACTAACATSRAASRAYAQGAPKGLASDTGAAARGAYDERYRPQYHFTPAVNWTNDPNGLVYYDGEYHLFYQHNPFGDTWGHMSWGHAVSPDLVHWQHLPVAIPEADGVMAFSGSAVVDWKNASGFGRGGKPPLVAVYTGASAGKQAQYVAYSTDRGRTWTRYAGNPVLDIGYADFRDPKVFWDAARGRWVMVTVLATEHRVRLYGSPDLLHWAPLSDFGPAAAVGGVWECPDLFELPVDGDPRNTRWVLIVNLNPGGIAGGSAAQYFVGRFDGTRFTPDAAAPSTTDPGAPGVRWADYGRDLYAAVSWSDAPQRPRTWIGWMNNWSYVNHIPTAPWRSAMSLPRTLALRTTPDGIRLVQEPAPEMEQLRGAGRRLGARTVGEGTTSLAPEGVAGKAVEIVAEFAVGPGTTAREFGLKVRAGANGDTTVIGVDARAGRIVVDRTRSGRVDFHPAFASREAAPLPVENGRGGGRVVRLRVFVDWSSVEVFAGGGRAVVTDQIFPDPASDGVALYAVGGTARLVSLEAWPLRSTWAGRGSRRGPA